MARSKYGNRRVKADGYSFDSQAEHRRFIDLQTVEQGGLITALTVHPRYKVLDSYTYQGKRKQGIVYEGDFSYVEDGQLVVEDVKGRETEGFKLKRKLFEARYPEIDLRIIPVKDVA